MKAPARLDWPKLNHINQHYIREADDTAALLDLVAEVYAKRGAAARRTSRSRSLPAVIALVKDGAQTLLELALT